MKFRIYYSIEHFDAIVNSSCIETTHPDLSAAKKWAMNEVMSRLIELHAQLGSRWNENIARIHITEIKNISHDTH
jgi:hypothetical protein